MTRRIWRIQQMSPRFVLCDQGHRGLTDSVRSSDRIDTLPVRMARANRHNFGVGEFSHAVPYALVNFIFQNIVFVAFILAARHEFQIGRPIIAFVAIFVIVLETLRALTNERLCYQKMDVGSALTAAANHAGVDSQIARSRSLDRRVPIDEPPNSSLGACFETIKSWDGSPFFHGSNCTPVELVVAR